MQVHSVLRTSLATSILAFSLPGSVLGQAPVFNSPGSSPYVTGQMSRFTNDFNPAFGLMFDFLGDYKGGDGLDGFNSSLRLMELNAAAYVDPNVWGYVALVSENAESPVVEEAAAIYVGFEGNSTIKAGRFFVDFGKQMQNHLEELRTLERPLPLREYLGEELAGEGVQYDTWFAAGESPIRFSTGVFASLLRPGEGGGPNDPVTSTPDRQSFDQISFSARLTGMTDVGQSGTFQFGTSARHVPEFSAKFTPVALATSGLSNTVYGLDATYGWTGDTGLEHLAMGGELLIKDGDLFTSLDDPVAPTALNISSGTATGYYLFADYGWNQQSSAGIQYALADLPQNPNQSQSEIDFYYTRRLTALRRLRIGVTVANGDAGDSARVYVQFTNFFGNHSHAVNW